MKISKRVREEAALFCAYIASAEFDDRPEVCPCAICVRSATGTGGDAYHLANRANAAIPKSFYPDSTGEDYGLRYAEAEALLRTGWTP